LTNKGTKDATTEGDNPSTIVRKPDEPGGGHRGKDGVGERYASYIMVNSMLQTHESWVRHRGKVKEKV
jgi:hypothetical protein